MHKGLCHIATVSIKLNINSGFDKPALIQYFRIQTRNNESICDEHQAKDNKDQPDAFLKTHAYQKIMNS